MLCVLVQWCRMACECLTAVLRLVFVVLLGTAQRTAARHRAYLCLWLDEVSALLLILGLGLYKLFDS